MNLYLVATGLPSASGAQLFSRLGELAVSYPQLDPATLWQVDGGSFFAASIHHSAQVAHPRKYVSRGDEVVFYDGLPVTVSTSLDALDAASLGARWTDLADLLEGQFVIVRVRPHERTVELKGDPLGLEQIYVLEQGGARYCSNSARLLEGIAGHSDTIDLTSAAMMASIGWVGGNRTLHPRVRVLPPGQHWS